MQNLNMMFKKLWMSTHIAYKNNSLINIFANLYNWYHYDICFKKCIFEECTDKTFVYRRYKMT